MTVAYCDFSHFFPNPIFFLLFSFNHQRFFLVLQFLTIPQTRMIDSPNDHVSALPGRNFPAGEGS
jgi:hypothetical protein